ncbi:MAG TPA: NAD(P)-dependent oxidoreductase [Bacteroidia bacterium]|nr:NAD(P)-dependent oxidoreductase [Bacteroidia bacterium]
MKIIVTGATGSLGAHLTRHFSSQGHQVFALGRVSDPPKALLKYARYIRAELTEPVELPAADVIVHTSGLANDHSSHEELFDANVTATRNVCDASRHIPTFIHISSSSVYRFSEDTITEDFISESRKSNLTPYGWSKLLGEEIIQEHCDSGNVFILRPRGIYGPGDKVLLPRLLGMVRKGKMVSPGKMNVRLSMTHFENLAHGIDCCIASGKNGKHTYNVTDNEPNILFDVLKKLLEAVNKRELDVKYIPIWLLRGMAALKLSDVSPLFLDIVTNDVVLDISRIRSELNYAPKKEFYSSVPEIVDWVERAGGIEVVKKGEAALAWV